MPRMSENQRHIDFILDETLDERIEREAKERGVSKGAIVREVLGQRFNVEPKIKEWQVRPHKSA